MYRAPSDHNCCCSLTAALELFEKVGYSTWRWYKSQFGVDEARTTNARSIHQGLANSKRRRGFGGIQILRVKDKKIDKGSEIFHFRLRT